MTRVIVASKSESRPARAGQNGGSATRVGPWELLRLAGAGSLAHVYQANPAGTPRERPAAYALKLPAPGWENDAAAIVLLRHEVMAARAANHPHVITVLSASLERPPYYLVMPWLEGATLAQRLARSRPLDLRTALWITRQVASALDALARALWIHGDVKPSNIFLSPDGHATLLDLGFARPIGAVHCLSDRCILGTPSYMAPELLTAASAADIQSDVYSLGAVLYELIAGRLPFDAADLGAMVAAHRQGRPPRLEELASGVPREVAQLASRMLAKDPLRRPAPAELVRRLTALEIAAMGREWAVGSRRSAVDS